MINISNDAIRRLLSPYGVDASASLCEKTRAYAELLLRWNQKIALTTVIEPSEIIRFHFGESLFALSVLSDLQGRLADFGSGAGFPGLPLKLVSPSTHVTLIESNVKKTAFLAEVIRQLELKDVEVFRGRAEDLPADHPPFDFAAARALGSHARILKWASRRLTPTGRVLLWLGGEDATTISHDPRWVWKHPTLIPGTKNRYILVGEAQRDT